jgi:hypothetical protein
MPAYMRFRAKTSIIAPSGGQFPALGPAIGDGAERPIGSVQSFGPAPRECFCRIVVTEDCYINVGDEDSASATNGDYWPAGTRDAEHVKKGQYVSVIAAA